MKRCWWLMSSSAGRCWFRDGTKYFVLVHEYESACRDAVRLVGGRGSTGEYGNSPITCAARDTLAPVLLINCIPSRTRGSMWSAGFFRVRSAISVPSRTWTRSRSRSPDAKQSYACGTGSGKSAQAGQLSSFLPMGSCLIFLPEKNWSATGGRLGRRDARCSAQRQELLSPVLHALGCGQWKLGRKEGRAGTLEVGIDRLWAGASSTPILMSTTIVSFFAARCRLPIGGFSARYFDTDGVSS